MHGHDQYRLLMISRENNTTTLVNGTQTRREQGIVIGHYIINYYASQDMFRKKNKYSILFFIFALEIYKNHFKIPLKLISIIKM